MRPNQDVKSDKSRAVGRKEARHACMQAGKANKGNGGSTHFPSAHALSFGV